MGGALLGVYTMRSFGECPNVEKESLLSQILEDHPHPKYSLSARACQGILNRAKKRGKVLPEMLRIALENQSVSLSVPDARGGVKEYSYKESEQEQSQPSIIKQCYGISAYESNAMKSDNPHSGVYEADTSRTLSINGGNPSCNQGGICVVDAVCVGNGQLCQARIQDKVGMLNTMHDQQAIITYGIDRAAYNQGKNAQFSFSVEEEKAQTIVAKGPGGGTNEKVGALCASDYKGIGNQYVNEGKLILDSRKMR